METQQRKRGWTGSTKQTLDQGAMLGGKWWSKGDKIHCIFQRVFDTKFGTGYNFLLVQPSSLVVAVDEFGICTKKGDGEQRQITQFAMPPLAGFDMAVQSLQSNGFDNFRFFDKVIIECVDIQEAKEFGYSDMPMFEISVDPR
jgi:hypothetical protein